MNKYGNKKCEYGGMKFDSKAEMERYKELALLERAGEIRELKLQPRFLMIPKQKGERAAIYIADFSYEEKGKLIVEDVKSEATKKNMLYIYKRKHFKEKYPEIGFREILR